MWNIFSTGNGFQKIFLNIVVVFSMGWIFLACDLSGSGKNTGSDVTGLSDDAADRPVSVYDYMDTLLADGFDFPAGNPDGKGPYTSLSDGKTYDSWYTAVKFGENYSLGIHTGIDLNGVGGGNTDQGQPVFAIGKGVVTEAKNSGAPWGKVVWIRHKYLHNGRISMCYSVYAHLDKMLVRPGDHVDRRDQIGTIGTGEGSFPAHLHFEIRKSNMQEYALTYWPSGDGKDLEWVKDHYENPATFIQAHRILTVPYKENRMIIAIKNQYRLFYFEYGKLIREYEIALSQRPEGQKQEQGDLKMPEGEYYISQKQKGPFYGNYAEFLGTRLLRTSYPNVYDAEEGYRKGLISKAEKDAIITANRQMKIPPKNTRLGGGIVIHGWKGDWIANGSQNLTWGCISMHNADLEQFYEIIPLKTKIIIVP